MQNMQSNQVVIAGHPIKFLKAPDVDMIDFVTALRRSFSSVSKEECEKYTAWTNKFGREGA